MRGNACPEVIITPGSSREQALRKKGSVKLINEVKIAHSFLQSVSNQFHLIILSLPI